MNGGPPGDLYVQVHIKPHAGVPARPRRPALRDADLVHHRRARRRDRDPDASTARRASACPAETQSGKTFRLKGKGIKGVRSQAPGDLFCHVVVETPVSLTERQRELLREFETISHEGQRAPQPARQGLAREGEGVLRG